MLPTANRKIAIDTSTDIEHVVIASIDRHLIECQQKVTVCQPRVDWDVDWMSIVGR